MAFDGFVTHGIVEELNRILLGGKIDKIYQPEKDELTLSVRTHEGTWRLLISAATANSRLHLTEKTRQNPINAPLFCMLLRKHLSGGKITAISQQGFDRIVIFDIECYTELGDLTKKSLVVEIMGKHSNIILVQKDNKIIDSIKHVDFTTSAVRQVLPGLFYEYPPSQDKKDPRIPDSESLAKKIALSGNDVLLDKLLLGEFVGMSPLMAREIVYRFTSDTKAISGSVDPERFSSFATNFIQTAINGEELPSIVKEKDSDKPLAFSYVNLSQYNGIGNIIPCESLSFAVEEFFSSRDLHERLTQKASGTVNLLNNNIERCEKKITIHRETIMKSKDREEYKIYGDLLTANLYRLNQGDTTATVTNYYSEEGEDITISIKPELTPSQNAQRYYKLYTKAKNAEEYSSKQLRDALDEKTYLESVLDSVNRASDYSDITEIRQELAEQGYIVDRNSKKKKTTAKSSPMKFVSSDGYTILVGRNNKQNDQLTIKTAYSTDLWLHTKMIPGSHVIIRTKGIGEVPDRTLVEAATIAAFFSKAQNSKGVPVDYTQVKNIRKPNGSKPGFVIYETNYTVYVDPDEKLVEKLKIVNL